MARVGVCEHLRAVLDELGEAGRIDLEWVSVDSSASVRSQGGPDRRQPGRSWQGRSKLHLAGERGGLPLAVVVSAANANASTLLEAVLDHISTGPDADWAPPARIGQGPCRQAYDHRRWRRLRIRYERSSERFYALAMLACSVICFNALQQPLW